MRRETIETVLWTRTNIGYLWVGSSHEAPPRDDGTCQPNGPGYQSLIENLPVDGTVLIRVGGYQGAVGEGSILVTLSP